jgi:hypothetical protein
MITKQLSVSFVPCSVDINSEEAEAQRNKTEEEIKEQQYKMVCTPCGGWV